MADRGVAGTTDPWTSNLRGPSGQLFGDPASGQRPAYGYLRVTLDMNSHTLTIAFTAPGRPDAADQLTVALR
ncbi:MAG: hypothetical protein KGL16_08590 [Acidobacteriota bacterium]|nr:hypothetical protein [Acidobacteriota bacterium]